jgi:hypothetical protein
MKNPATTLAHVLGVVSIVVWFVLFAGFTPSFSIAKAPEPGGSQPRRGIARAAETNRVLRVLENKMEGQFPQDKAMHKLSTMSRAEIRLLDSLAARVTKSTHTAASDIAFLLITTLLISS